MTVEYNFDYHPLFCDEYKKIFKKCPSFADDFKMFKEAINADLDMFNHILPKKYKHISRLGSNVDLPVFKFRGLYCKKGDGSKFRFIFILDRAESLIIFVELYHKGKKENEDRNRIINCFENR